MKVQITRACYLTDEHSASSHGLPVLVRGSVAYGPRDVMEDYRGGIITAAAYVERWLSRPRTRAEREAGESFLSAWAGTEAEESRPCGLCGGELLLLGSLGRRAHYKCRNCGMLFNREKW